MGLHINLARNSKVIQSIDDRGQITEHLSVLTLNCEPLTLTTNLKKTDNGAKCPVFDSVGLY